MVKSPVPNEKAVFSAKVRALVRGEVNLMLPGSPVAAEAAGAKTVRAVACNRPTKIRAIAALKNDFLASLWASVLENSDNISKKLVAYEKCNENGSLAVCIREHL